MFFLPPNRNLPANRPGLTRRTTCMLLVLLFLGVNGSVAVLHAKERSRTKAVKSISKTVGHVPMRDEDTQRSRQAQPASVTLANGQLTVRAVNSDLEQILDRVSKLSGMQVSGSGSSAHVFGVYGPGNPQIVLTRLLAGSGYNFMMVGRTTVGTPRTLLLMARSDAPEPVQQINQQNAGSSAGNAQENSDSSASSTQDQEPLGPGAIAHVPPSEQQANQEDPQTRMQQHLQQLQQQFQEQQQKQPQQ